jgi:4-hydroxy-tetrahydrodipicolinate reductase
VPVISGTTGWLEQYDGSALHRKKWRFHLSSNFSLGVNIFFEINEYLAKMMAKLDHYSIEMEEITILRNLMLQAELLSLAKGN